MTVVVLKIGEIRELIRLVDETSINELAIETEDMKFRLKKSAPEVVTVPQQANYVPVQNAPIPAAAIGGAELTPSQQDNRANSATGSGGPSKSEVDESLHIIVAPMVGTFYRAPSPDASVYVNPGSKVSEKSVVCIIEAMKLMNEIEAEVQGEVIEVLAENGQLVEYGQPLFRIRRS